MKALKDFYTRLKILGLCCVIHDNFVTRSVPLG